MQVHVYFFIIQLHVPVVGIKDIVCQFRDRACFFTFILDCSRTPTTAKHVNDNLPTKT